MVAQLSPKRKLSHAGILTLGGFTIDPRYVGRLLLGLFNFSSTPFPLIPGKKVIAATFYKLEGSELGEFPDPGEPLDDFPDELVQVMQKYHPVALQSLTDLVNRLQNDDSHSRNAKRTLVPEGRSVGSHGNSRSRSSDSGRLAWKDHSRNLNLWKRPKLPKTDAYRMNASEFDAMMRRALGAARRSNRFMVKK